MRCPVLPVRQLSNATPSRKESPRGPFEQLTCQLIPCRQEDAGQLETGKTFGAIALVGGTLESEPTFGKITSKVAGDCEICLACMYRSPLWRARPQRPIRAAPDTSSAASVAAVTSTIEELVVRSTSTMVTGLTVRGRPDAILIVLRKNALSPAVARRGERMTKSDRVFFFTS